MLITKPNFKNKKKLPSYTRQEVLDVKGKELHFTVTYTSRSTIGITVKRTGEVSVRVPFQTNMAEVRSVIARKAEWIISKQDYFTTRFAQSYPLTYQDGEQHLFLGRTYTLNVVEAPHEEVRLHGDYIVVAVKDASRTEKVLSQWYRQQSRDILLKMADRISAEFYHRRKKVPTGFSLRKMKRRWGSCSASGSILLNTELIKAPVEAIAYVITHELCHLIHHNHSKAYYDVLSTEFPTWKEARQMLETVPLD